jgi:hypothetical protein
VQATARGHGAADGAGGPADEPPLQHAGRRLRHHSVLLGQALHKQARPPPTHPTSHLFGLRCFKSLKAGLRTRIRIGVNLKMLDPDPDEMYTESQPCLKDHRKVFSSIDARK